MTDLKLLTNGALHMADEEFRSGQKELNKDDLSKYVEHPNFSIEIDSLMEKIDEVIKDYSSKDTAIDGELAQIIHQELDLTRRQASNPEIWNYLSIYEKPEFVIHRWGKDAAKERWIVRSRSKQSLNRQAFSSLWWVAEVTHSKGRGYDFTEKVFKSQEFKNWLMGPSYGRSPNVMNALIAELHDLEDDDQYREVMREFTALTSTFSVDSMNEKEIRRLVSELRSYNNDDNGPSVRKRLVSLFG